jgi:hypothetical protein
MDSWAVDPGRMVIVEELSERTILALIAHLEVSEAFDHLVYREAELDALWCIVELAGKESARRGAHEAEQLRLREVLVRVRDAHDRVREDRTADAADRLRELLVDSLI